MNVCPLSSMLLVAVVVGGCQTQVEGEEPGKLPASLRERLDRELHRVQLTEGPQLKSLLDGIAEFGPYATDPVKEKLLGSDSARLRSNAVYVLSEIFRNDADQDALEAVRGALADGDPSVRLEAARALLELHDRSGVRELVVALESERRGLRVPAFLALRHETGDDFGYNPYDPPERRAGGASRFREHFGIETAASATPQVVSGSARFAESPDDGPVGPAPGSSAQSPADRPADQPDGSPADSDLPTVPPPPDDDGPPASEPADGDDGDCGGGD